MIDKYQSLLNDVEVHEVLAFLVDRKAVEYFVRDDGKCFHVNPNGFCFLSIPESWTLMHISAIAFCF